MRSINSNYTARRSVLLSVLSVGVFATGGRVGGRRVFVGLLPR